ncbi:MAG: glycosyltransferase family 2 protein, partial [Caldilineae bacterium]
PRSLWASEAPFPVDFVLGAALMVRREAIHQVGLLDDGFFMYCEEMDWCLRMQEAGWRIYAAPAARVIHHEGQSSKQVRWRSFERLWRSRLRFFRKHHNRYSSRFLLAVNGLLRIGLGLRAQLAWRAFAAGRVDGAALRQELTAYANVSRML